MEETMVIAEIRTHGRIRCVKMLSPSITFSELADSLRDEAEFGEVKVQLLRKAKGVPRILRKFLLDSDHYLVSRRT